jgi:hypothetical protein
VEVLDKYVSYLTRPLCVQPLIGVAKYLAGMRFYFAACKYIHLHKDMFGNYKYGLPPKPRRPEALNMTFLEWIKEHDLEIMKPFFLYSQAAQVLISISMPTFTFMVLFFCNVHVSFLLLSQQHPNMAVQA